MQYGKYLSFVYVKLEADIAVELIDELFDYFLGLALKEGLGNNSKIWETKHVFVMFRETAAW